MWNCRNTPANFCVRPCAINRECGTSYHMNVLCATGCNKFQLRPCASRGGCVAQLLCRGVDTRNGYVVGQRVRVRDHCETRLCQAWPTPTCYSEKHSLQCVRGGGGWCGLSPSSKENQMLWHKQGSWGFYPRNRQQCSNLRFGEGLKMRATNFLHSWWSKPKMLKISESQL